VTLGLIDFTGATIGGNPFTFACPATNQPNVVAKTNYFLTATNDKKNPNYARSLNTVTESTNGGNPTTVGLPNPVPNAFNVGASTCPGNNAATQPFPSITTSMADAVAAQILANAPPGPPIVAICVGIAVPLAVIIIIVIFFAYRKKTTGSFRPMSPERAEAVKEKLKEMKPSFVFKPL